MEELKLWLEMQIDISKGIVAEEKLSGNVVKENFAKGELCSYEKSLQQLQLIQNQKR